MTPQRTICAIPIRRMIKILHQIFCREKTETETETEAEQQQQREDRVH